MAHLSLIHDIKTGLYETTHSGITYCLPHGLVRELKNYFAAFSRYNNGIGIVAKWYDDLGKEDRVKVIRKGIAEVKDDFTPDKEPEY